MPGDETLQKHAEESDSEDDDDVAEPIPKIDIDPSKLTPLSPEVISKQVSLLYNSRRSIFTNVNGRRQ